MDSKICPLLINLHLILVGNSPTKFSTFGTRDTTTRSNEEEALGKHLNNIFSSVTNQVSVLPVVISHILGTAKLWDQFWSTTQGCRLDKHAPPTTFLAHTLWDSRLHDCILLMPPRDY